MERTRNLRRAISILLDEEDSTHDPPVPSRSTRKTPLQTEGPWVARQDKRVMERVARHIANTVHSAAHPPTPVRRALAALIPSYVQGPALPSGADAIATIASQQATIAEHEAAIAQHEATIAQHEATIAQHEATIAEQAATIARLREENARLQQQVEHPDADIFASLGDL
jgi:septal ring factor EnvC (AmiA/AmiB activator)